MLIENAFKEFTIEVLKETKNKKDYDYCIDTYSTTQLVDISGVTDLAELASLTDKYKPEFVKDKDNNRMISIALPKSQTIMLPFDECFIKVFQRSDNDTSNIRSVFVFIHEIFNLIYSGTIITYATTGHILKIPFHITPNLKGLILTLDFSCLRNDLSDDVMQKTISNLLRSIIIMNATLARLNSKNQYIYKVNPTKPEYLRKKLSKKSIKVERPIYIYLDKNNNISRTHSSYSDRTVTRLSSWIVRGHWRRLDNPKKRGKDSNGNYIVEGFTWVVPHTVGNSHEIKNKTYIAIQGKN